MHCLSTKEEETVAVVAFRAVERSQWRRHDVRSTAAGACHELCSRPGSHDDAQSHTEHVWRPNKPDAKPNPRTNGPVPNGPNGTDEPNGPNEPGFLWPVSAGGPAVAASHGHAAGPGPTEPAANASVQRSWPSPVAMSRLVVIISGAPVALTGHLIQSVPGESSVPGAQDNRSCFYTSRSQY